MARRTIEYGKRRGAKSDLFKAILRLRCFGPPRAVLMVASVKAENIRVCASVCTRPSRGRDKERTKRPCESALAGWNLGFGKSVLGGWDRSRTIAMVRTLVSAALLKPRHFKTSQSRGKSLEEKMIAAARAPRHLSHRCRESQKANFRVFFRLLWHAAVMLETGIRRYRGQTIDRKQIAFLRELINGSRRPP